MSTKLSQKKREFHEPPSGVDYTDNPTVFGKILAGKASAHTIAESANLLAFHDHAPWAPLHALVIPKRLVVNINNLQASDLKLIEEMHEMAKTVLKEHQPKAFEEGDFVLCYHPPPFNMINHLHLHVLAPASERTWIGKAKFWPDTPWCISSKSLQDTLRNLA